MYRSLKFKAIYSKREFERVISLSICLAAYPSIEQLELKELLANVNLNELFK